MIHHGFDFESALIAGKVWKPPLETLDVSSDTQVQVAQSLVADQTKSDNYFRGSLSGIFSQCSEPNRASFGRASTAPIWTWRSPGILPFNLSVPEVNWNERVDSVSNN